MNVQAIFSGARFYRPLGALTLTLCAAAFAQAQSASPQPERRHRPPRVAVTACDGKAVGAACSFTSREGKPLEGQCVSPPPRPADPSGRSSDSSNNRNISPPTPMVVCQPAH